MKIVYILSTGIRVGMKNLKISSKIKQYFAVRTKIIKRQKSYRLSLPLSNKKSTFIRRYMFLLCQHVSCIKLPLSLGEWE